MKIKYPHIAKALLEEVWAVQPTKMAAIVEFVCSKMFDEPSAAKFTPAQDRKVAAQQGSIMVMPLQGVISNRASLVQNQSEPAGTSTEAFGRAFMAAVNNEEIKAIIIDTNSPGGVCAGTPELFELIYNARDKKPIIAQVNSMAASAAYWLACAASEIVVTPSGSVGSIGVVTVHEDISKRLEEDGVKVTFIHAGQYKVEGNYLEPLGDEAKAQFQKSVDEFYSMFQQAVAKGRGVTVKEVEANFGRGRMVGAKEAVSLGMADRVGTMEDTLARFGVSLYASKQSTNQPVSRMAARGRLKALTQGETK
ncbi:MAG: S49 family peptidase [Bdellovibrionales bacterium]